MKKDFIEKKDSYPTVNDKIFNDTKDYDTIESSVDTDQGLSDMIFSINEDVFQNAKEYIYRQELLREASAFTLKGRFTEIFLSKLMVKITAKMTRDLALSAVSPVGIVATIYDIITTYKPATSDIKDCIKKTISDAEIERLTKEFILVSMFTEISKSNYLKASRLENDGLSAQNERLILKTLFASSAYNALAEYFSKDQLEYYRKKEILSRQNPALRLVYNTLSITSEYGEELISHYLPQLKTEVDKIASDMLNDIKDDIFERIGENVLTLSLKDVNFYDVIKKAVGNFNIKIDENGVNISVKRNNNSMLQKIENINSMLETYKDVISNDANSKLFLYKLKEVEKMI